MNSIKPEQVTAELKIVFKSILKDGKLNVK